jgi:hypothetical protein
LSNYYQDNNRGNSYDNRQPYQQNPYGGAPVVPKFNNDNPKAPNYYEKPMSVGQWFGTLILLAIPIIGEICFIIWLFGGGKYRQRVNYVRAMLIPVILAIIAVIIIFAAGGLAMLSSLS